MVVSRDRTPGSRPGQNPTNVASTSFTNKFKKNPMLVGAAAFGIVVVTVVLVVVLTRGGENENENENEKIIDGKIYSSDYTPSNSQCEEPLYRRAIMLEYDGNPRYYDSFNEMKTALLTCTSCPPTGFYDPSSSTICDECPSTIYNVGDNPVGFAETNDNQWVILFLAPLVPTPFVAAPFRNRALHPISWWRTGNWNKAWLDTTLSHNCN